MWNLVLKNDQDQIANINLSLRAKLPKRAIIAGDLAYLIIYDYNRADKAQLVYPDGRVQNIECGNTSSAVTYEILGAERAILTHSYSESQIDLTEQVTRLMDYFLTAATN